MSRPKTRAERQVEQLRETRPFVYRAMADVAEARGILVVDLVGHDQTPYISEARQDVMLALHRQGWSKTAIGGFLGCRHHSTAVYGIKRAKAREEAAQGAQQRARQIG